jgi:DNA-binding MarR family transcriptional regulator
MPRRGASPAADAVAHSDYAVRRIDAACRLAVAGKLALRDLAAWVRGYGVSECEFRLLWLLFPDEREGATRGCVLDQGELADRLAVSAAQVSGVVERLQASELIDRVRDGADRRRQLWRLAHAGEALVLDVVASVQTHVEIAASAIPPLAPPFEGGGFRGDAA